MTLPNYIFGVSMKGGYYHELASKLHRSLGHVLSIKILPMGTSQNSLSGIVQNKIDLALVQGNIFSAFLSSSSCALGYLCTPLKEHLTLVARFGDNIYSGTDLIGKRIGLNHAGSGTYDLAGKWADLYDSGKDSILVRGLNTEQSLEKLLMKKIDAFFVMQPHPAPLFVDAVRKKTVRFVHSRMRSGARLDELDPGRINMKCYGTNLQRYSPLLVDTWCTDVRLAYSRRLSDHHIARIKQALACIY